MHWLYKALVATSLLVMGALHAGEADIVDLAIINLGNDQFRIDATVIHADTGWQHYANRWDVSSTEGAVLGSRKLLHPHESEQPFTRSLTLTIPPDVTEVVVRAHDLEHELGGATMTITVPH